MPLELQEFLSEMLGVQRSSVTLVARHLQEAGLINYRRGRIHVLDVEGLQDHAANATQRSTDTSINSSVGNPMLITKPPELRAFDFSVHFCRFVRFPTELVAPPAVGQAEGSDAPLLSAHQGRN